MTLPLQFAETSSVTRRMFFVLGALTLGVLSRSVLETVVLRLWSSGHLSGGKAGRLLGMSRVKFWEFAGKRGATWPYFPEDLEQDIATMKKLGWS